jgi:hypothetical protein
LKREKQMNSGGLIFAWGPATGSRPTVSTRPWGPWRSVLPGARRLAGIPQTMRLAGKHRQLGGGGGYSPGNDLGGGGDGGRRRSRTLEGHRWSATTMSMPWSTEKQTGGEARSKENKKRRSSPKEGEGNGGGSDFNSADDIPASRVDCGHRGETGAYARSSIGRRRCGKKLCRVALAVTFKRDGGVMG